MHLVYVLVEVHASNLIRLLQVR